jgi:hypothetical protein
MNQPVSIEIMDNPFGIENGVKVKTKEEEKKRAEVKILKVLSIAPGGNRAWVLTNVGKLKKPLRVIDRKLLDEYERGQNES